MPVRATLIAAAIATAALAMAGLGRGLAHADLGTLTPQGVRYLAQLNAAGVPFTDPYSVNGAQGHRSASQRPHCCGHDGVGIGRGQSSVPRSPFGTSPARR